MAKKKAAKKSNDFTLRVHETGGFGKTHREAGQRSSGVLEQASGFQDLEADELRLHGRAIKTRGRGPAEVPRREREADD
jgi:hypothetical protein